MKLKLSPHTHWRMKARVNFIHNCSNFEVSRAPFSRNWASRGGLCNGTSCSSEKECTV